MGKKFNINELIHQVGKLLDGSFGDGVSYEDQKKISKKGSELESEIIAKGEEQGFKVVSNLYIEYGKQGKTTEVDVVLVNRKGIYVVEAKNYNCVIKGNVSNQKLQTIYPNKKKYDLYNPIKQNETHISILSKEIGLNESELNPLIVFGKKSSIKLSGTKKVLNTVMTINELEKELQKINRQRNKYSEKEVTKIIKKLQSYEGASTLTKFKHRKDVNKKKRK